MLYYLKIEEERDGLGTQLLRRNDELRILYEKLQLQEQSLNKGAAEYDKRIEDLRLLKLEIKRLR